MAVFNKKIGLACRQAGFTLIELLVAMSIIATLTAILLPNFMGARERAADAKKKQEMAAIKTALRFFYNETQNYPTVANIAALGTTLAPFMPAMAGIGYSYNYAPTNNGDGFNLWVETSSGVSDNQESQSRCGQSAADDKYYYVCAN